MELKNKTVVVTGGSDGIGKNVCMKLAQEGCRLVILGRDKDRLQSIAKTSKELGASAVRTHSVDFTDVQALSAVSKSILDDCDQVDVLINNAGIWHKAGPLDSIDPDLLVSTVQTNLTALMQLTQKILPKMRQQEEAIILNIASKSGVVAQAGQSVYSATKYGVRGFTDVLKEDEKSNGVRVAGLYQSGTNTEMFAKAGEDVPNHIFTEPEDLADVVVFMLSRPPKIWLHEVRVEL